MFNRFLEIKLFIFWFGYFKNNLPDKKINIDKEIERYFDNSFKAQPWLDRNNLNEEKKKYLKNLRKQLKYLGTKFPQTFNFLYVIENGKTGFDRLSSLEEYFSNLLKINYWVTFREAFVYPFYKFKNKVEKMRINEIRVKKGLPKVGEGWISETKLFRLVERIFYQYQVIFHFRDYWLEGMELDIYVPKIKLAIEYMGKQHYEPIDYFGGAETHLGVVERDKLKKKLCDERGIKLVYFKYEREVTMKNLKRVLKLGKS